MIAYIKAPNFVTDLTTLTIFKSQLASKTRKEAVQFLDEVRAHLEAAALTYNEKDDKKCRFESFAVGDLVMAHISKGGTPARTYSKL